MRVKRLGNNARYSCFACAFRILQNVAFRGAIFCLLTSKSYPSRRSLKTMDLSLVSLQIFEE